MSTNPYRPPDSEIVDNSLQSKNLGILASRAVAAFCFISGIVRMVVITHSSAQIDISMTTIYVYCVGPMLMCILGYLIYTHSKYALPGAIAAIVIPVFLSPISSYLIESDLGRTMSSFDYWHSLTTEIGKIHALDWLLQAALIIYTGWDYRDRLVAFFRQPV